MGFCQNGLIRLSNAGKRKLTKIPFAMDPMAQTVDNLQLTASSGRLVSTSAAAQTPQNQVCLSLFHLQF